MIWKYLKRFYYTLFCDHRSHKSEKYYTLNYVHGYYELKVYVCRVCEKCGKTDTFQLSANEAPASIIKPMVKLLEEKGYRNAEDLNYD